MEICLKVTRILIYVDSVGFAQINFNFSLNIIY